MALLRSGQRLENVNRTHLVFTSGTLVVQKRMRGREGSPGRAGRGVGVAQDLLLAGGQVEGGQAQGLADPVAAVRVEEESHALRSEVPVAILGACGATTLP